MLCLKLYLYDNVYFDDGWSRILELKYGVNNGGKKDNLLIYYFKKIDKYDLK